MLQPLRSALRAPQGAHGQNGHGEEEKRPAPAGDRDLVGLVSPARTHSPHGHPKLGTGTAASPPGANPESLMTSHGCQAQSPVVAPSPRRQKVMRKHCHPFAHHPSKDDCSTEELLVLRTHQGRRCHRHGQLSQITAQVTPSPQLQSWRKALRSTAIQIQPKSN